MVDGDGNYHTPECVSRRPTLLELITYAKQAAAGIWHIHRACILHRWGNWVDLSLFWCFAWMGCGWGNSGTAVGKPV